MSVFKNTISYGTFYKDDGNITALADTWFPIITTAYDFEDNLVKEINTGVTASGGYISVNQDGAYYIDFSFIADSGDSKTYTLAPFINNVIQAECKLQFFQQATSQKYEVSGSYIFELIPSEKLLFKLFVGVLPTSNLEIKDIKLTIINLQQLGVH